MFRHKYDRAHFQGFVDALNSDEISGWAWNTQYPTDPIDVSLYVDGRHTRTVRAHQLGADLVSAGIGDGRHRWSCSLASLTNDNAVHQISARFDGTDIDLTNSPKGYLRDVLDLVTDLQPQALAAAIYLRGNGIEIGALNHPLTVPADSHTSFVDRMTTEELRREYPEIRDYDLVSVSIVADGETLEGVEDESQDYVIANNFLEHCQDPIGTIKNFFRVVRKGGVLFLVVPNKRSNIDAPRRETPIEHFIRDHEEGPATSRLEHFQDWTRTILKVSDDTEVARRVDELMEAGYSIHFHVFTEFQTIELFCLMRNRYNIPFVFECVANNGCHETVIVARKE